jgi:DNA-binding transcriptional MerR regulator
MNESASFSLVLVHTGTAAPASYSLEAASALAGVHPEMLRYYCQLGLFGETRTQPDVELVFDDDALYELRRFEHYRLKQGVDRKTLRLICGLWRDIERLETELRFLRAR